MTATAPKNRRNVPEPKKRRNNKEQASPILSATNATPARTIRGGRCALTTGRRNRFISPAYIFYNTAPVSKTHYIAVYCRVQRQPFDSVIRPVSYILDGALDRRGRVINDRTFSDEFVPNLVSTMFVEAISLPLHFSRKRAAGNERLGTSVSTAGKRDIIQPAVRERSSPWVRA